MSNYTPPSGGSVRSAPYEAPSKRTVPISPERGAAIAVWLAGVYLTWLFVVSLMPTAPLWLPILVSALSQAALTVLERRAVRGQYRATSVIPLAFDVAFNTAGLYPIAMQLGATPFARIAADFHVAPQVGPAAALLIGAVVGYAVAAAPEELWRNG